MSDSTWILLGKSRSSLALLLSPEGKSLETAHRHVAIHGLQSVADEVDDPLCLLMASLIVG